MSSICGITQNELETALHPYVEKFAQKQGISVEDAEERLREHCAGYHFCEDTEEIYNPAGLHNCLTQKDFNYCWFETGTPSF